MITLYYYYIVMISRPNSLSMNINKKNNPFVKIIKCGYQYMEPYIYHVKTIEIYDNKCFLKKQIMNKYDFIIILIFKKR